MQTPRLNHDGKAPRPLRSIEEDTSSPVGIGRQSSFPLWEAMLPKSRRHARWQSHKPVISEAHNTRTANAGSTTPLAWVHLGCCPTFIRHSCTRMVGRDHLGPRYILGTISTVQKCQLSSSPGASLRCGFCAACWDRIDSVSVQDNWRTRNSVSGSRTPRAPRRWRTA
jgi:hypothetical protein